MLLISGMLGNTVISHKMENFVLCNKEHLTKSLA